MHDGTDQASLPLRHPASLDFKVRMWMSPQDLIRHSLGCSQYAPGQLYTVLSDRALQSLWSSASCRSEFLGSDDSRVRMTSIFSSLRSLFVKNGPRCLRKSIVLHPPVFWPDIRKHLTKKSGTLNGTGCGTILNQSLTCDLLL